MYPKKIFKADTEISRFVWYTLRRKSNDCLYNKREKSQFPIGWNLNRLKQKVTDILKLQMQ